MTTQYLNVSSAADLSVDIKAIDLASQGDGGNGANYLITLAKGATRGKRRHFRDQPHGRRHPHHPRQGRRFERR